MKTFLSVLLLVMLGVWSTGAKCQQWRVIEFQWKDKQARIGDGNLQVSLDKETKTGPAAISGEYTFIQYLVLGRAAKSIVVSSCSIVSNRDTSGGFAGALLESNGKRIAVYMNHSTTLLQNPRVCLVVYR